MKYLFEGYGMFYKNHNKGFISSQYNLLFV